MDDDVVAAQLAIDRYALLALLQDGELRTSDGKEIRATQEYVVLPNEYAAVFKAALEARLDHAGACAGDLHDIAEIMLQPCPCTEGWVPALEPSFLSAALPVPVRIAQTPAASLGWRVRLRSAMDSITEAEAALLAGLLHLRLPLVACVPGLSPPTLEFLADIAVEVIDLSHACPNHDS
ncbi:hypothetical protein EV645_8127 [Kribbella rubisoli]|uniref:Uncharacterized protein n=1 Tax=Kribbella rubisoli TaxID=3075929 RepID=A0A4Q7VX33_9ACTN|nr:hypothetical protein [Kribbella rubisoli]RZU01297.1 hypothetical protein EV645_8127 [Kribbella rubisoli]